MEEKRKFNQFKGSSGTKFNGNQSKVNNSWKGDKKQLKSPHQKHQKNKYKNSNEESKTKKFTESEKKVNYVLNPKALRRRIKEVKESEQSVKEKSLLQKSKILIWR